MVIRGNQIASLSNSMGDTFDSEMFNHLQRCFPADCSAIGDAGVRDTIQYGVERSRGYGITASREVCAYIDVMMVFGRDFDSDPNLPWAASILNSKRFKDTSGKIDQLQQTAKQHYDQRIKYSS